MDASSYVVRAPALADAAALGRVHCAVWQATYAEVMDPAAYAALSPARFEAGWRRRLERDVGEGGEATGPGPLGEVTRIAEHRSGQIVGFMSVGPARDADPPAGLQLWSLNLVPEHQGTGLADRLMSEVLGGGPAYLWVARGNARAIRFYQRHEFALDGAEIFDGHDGITEVRMVRRG
ncbi:MAG: GNAT family N-acetyltransferase [Ornithinimicrobium sp.]